MVKTKKLYLCRAIKHAKKIIMNKKLSAFVLFLFFSIFIFSQDGNKTIEKNGELFYSSVEKTEDFYNIIIEIFELGNIKYIEVELYNAEEVKLASNIAELKLKNKKVFLIYNEKESEISIYDINLKLNNVDDSIDYPRIKIKLLDQNYNVVDYSQKTFY